MMQWASPDPEPMPSFGGADAPGGIAPNPAAPPSVLAARLRPRRTVAIVDDAIGLVRRHPGLLLGLSTAVVVPLAVVSMLLFPATRGSGSSSTSLGALLGTKGSSGAFVFGLVVASLSTAVIGVAVTMVVVGEGFGVMPTAGSVLRRTARLLPKLLVAWVLAKILVTLSACLLPLSVVTLTFSSLVSPVLAAERLGPWKAIRRSWHLVGLRFGGALGLVLTIGLLSVLARTGLLLLAAIPFLTVGYTPGWFWVVSRIVSWIGTIVTLPVAGAAAAYFYVDARVRAEGLDLDLEIRRVFGVA